MDGEVPKEIGVNSILPIFKNFVRQALYKDEFKSFTIPEEIYFAAINYNTGKKENFSNSNSIVEAFKLSDIKKMKNNKLDKDLNYDSLIKFRQFY